MSALLDLSDIQPAALDLANIPFGEWLPDLPTYENPGAIEALNVIPAEGSYIPFLQHVPNPVAILDDVVRGAAAVIQEADIIQLYVGSVNGVFTSAGTSFVNILAAPVSADYAWKFIRVNNVMVALHPGHVPVYSTVDTIDPAVNVPGNPPTAVCGAQVSDFLMLGNLIKDPDDFNNAFPSRIRWSGQNNIGSPWISDPATQADFQDMPPEGGAIVAIAGREVGTIYQQRMISRATYRGPPEIFDIVTVEDKRGAIARDCIVDVGQFQFFIAEDGFFIWNGTNSTPISDGKVNRYFFNKLNYAARSKICGAVDFTNGCVLWAFPTSSSGALDEILIYSYRVNKWTHSIQTLEFLFNSAASNVTLDELTDPLESYDISFDDAFFRQGGRSRVAAFNDSHAYGLFNGDPMPAVIDTGEFSGPNGLRVFVNGVRPLVDVAVPSAQIQVAVRDQLMGQPPVFSSPVDQEVHGFCPIIADARFMRFRLLLDEGVNWGHAVGVDVSRKSTGIF